MTRLSALVPAVAAAGLTALLVSAGVEARPAVSFSQVEREFSLEQCLELARATLQEEAFQVGAGEAGSVTGASPTYGVVISCTPLGRRVLIEVFTAADRGSDPAELHARILRGLDAGAAAGTGSSDVGSTATGGATTGSAAATGSTATGSSTTGSTTATGGGATAGSSAAGAAGSVTTGGGASSGGTAATAGGTSTTAATGAAGGATTTAAGTTDPSTDGAAASVPLSSEWHMVREAAINGQNDKKLYDLTARQCLEACEAEPRCQSVDFNRVTGQCNLAYRTAKTTLNKFHQHVCYDYYSRDESDREVLKPSSFAAELPPVYGTWRKTPNAFLHGKSYTIRKMEGSVIACADACATADACKSFNHFPNTATCSLLKVSACEVGTDYWGNGTTAQYHYTQEGSSVFVEAGAATSAAGAPTGQTRWSTGFGDVVLDSLQPGAVGGRDPSGIGEIVAELNGQTLRGHWVRKDDGERCATEFDGSRNWGKLEFVFDAGFLSFTGRFGFCDGALEQAWSGDRQPSAVAAGVAELVSEMSGWRVDYGKFEATASQIDASPAGDGKTSYYIAPGDLVGSLTGYGSLVFEKKSSGGSYYGPDSYGASGDVILQSGDMTARFDLEADHSGEWKAYRIPLDGAGWTLSGGADTLGAILSSITELKIRAEYGAGTDYSSLRGVQLVP